MPGAQPPPHRGACVVWLTATVVALLTTDPLHAQTLRQPPTTPQTSGSPDARAEFRRGLAALHDFEYEEANDAFRTAQQRHPGFVMAYWGEAMTYHQTLWRNEDVSEARRILARLGPTPSARAAKTSSDMESAFLASVEVLFGEGDVTARRAAYARAMEQMYLRWPDDPDVAALFALALLGTMSRGLIGSGDVHEGHSEGLAGSATQSRVATILERILESHPEHPGALHYLLHNYDDPEHARLALSAARRYTRVARSSHALHMPAHIFLQLGLWHQAAEADAAAYAASAAWVKRRSLPAAMRDYHALAWREYELLQLGRFREASETISEIVPVVRESRQTTLLSSLASMRARFVIETRRWNVLADARNFGNVNELFAIGVSAARTGNAAAAELARQGLAERAQSPPEGDLRPAIAIMERQVAALIELAGGRHARAVDILREAARAEQQLPPPLGPPTPIKPAGELLGEVLLEAGRAREAIVPLEQALQRHPNRSLAVLALARAAVALGETEAARKHYGALLANYEGADADLPEVREARAATLPPDGAAGANDSPPSSLTPFTLAATGMTLGLLVVGRMAIRRFGLIKPTAHTAQRKSHTAHRPNKRRGESK